jgi:hypothetical protein
MKQFLMMVVVCLVPASAHADPELALAFKGGPNAATLAHDHRAHRYGFSGGGAGYLQRPLTQRVSLAGQLELLYTPRGAVTIVEGELLGKHRLHYLDVTAAARPGVRLGHASVYLLLGAGLSLLASADKENAFGAKLDITDGLHRIDVTLLAGAGLALHLPRPGLGPLHLDAVLLEARHDRGLREIAPDATGFRNRSSSLLLGVSLTLASGARSPRSVAPITAMAAGPVE